MRIPEPERLNEYAARGFAMLPLSRSRRPLVEDWPNKPEYQAAPILEAMMAAKSQVMGIITGPLSGVFVLDVDHDAAGADSLFYWLEEFGPLPDTPVVSTPHGQHYYFEYDPRVTGRVGVAPGIDVKSAGGYVVAPPSRLPDSSSYFWDVDLTTPIAKAPEWLIECIKRPEFKPGGKFKIPDVIEKGTRNVTLFKIGCSVRGRGGSDYHVHQALSTANDTLCDVPLSAGEIQTIARSVCRYGIGNSKFNPQGGAGGELVVVGAEDPYPALLKGPYPLTQIGLAQRMADMIGTDVRYCHPWGCWVIWDGTRWVRDQTAGAPLKRHYRNMVRNLFRVSTEDKEKRWLISQETNGACDSTVKLLASCEGIPVLPGEFDAGDWVLNCKNGIVDLRSGKMRPHLRSDMCTRMTGAAYEESDCPKFKKVMLDAMMGDHAQVDWLWRWLGYGCTGSISEEIFTFFWGPSGQNGKSTILEAVSDVLGSYSATLATSALMDQGHKSANNDEIAKLTGVRFVTAQETGENSRFSDDLIKNLAGDKKISCCQKYGHPFDLDVKFKLTISGNNKPKIGSFDAAFSRRLRLVSFLYRVPDDERDDSLKTVGLPMEYSGVLWHLVQAARRWIDVGLGQTETMVEASESYKMEQDSVRAWMAARMKPFANSTKSQSVAYSDYETWCDSNKLVPVGIQRWSQRVSSQYVTKTICGVRMLMDCLVGDEVEKFDPFAQA